MSHLRAALILAAAAAVLVAGVVFGRRAPPPATVQTTSTATVHDQAKVEAKRTDVHEQHGAITTTVHTETRAPSGAVTTRTVTRLEAPVQIERVVHDDKSQEDHAEGRAVSELRQTPASPAAPPRWSLSLSLDNALEVALEHQVPQVRVAAGMRLVGPVWAEISARPPLGGPAQVGAGISVRW